MNKINSYVGFAIKSRKVIYGADAILDSKHCKLILASEKLSENSINKLKTKNISLVVLPESQFSQLNTKGLAIGITDQSLAKAIQNNIAQ